MAAQCLSERKSRLQKFHENNSIYFTQCKSGDRLRAEAAAAQTELAALTAMVKEQQQMQEQDKNRGLEEKFNKLKVKIRGLNPS